MPNFPRLLSYLAFSLRRLNWKQEKLLRYQEKKLRSIVRYAYDNVPFYHKKLRQVGVFPDDIRRLCDLEKIPIVKKAELRQVHLTDLLSREFNVYQLKPIRTSGSTGQPFVFYISSRENDWRKAIYMRANISCGQKPRDNWVVITSPHHFSDTTHIQRMLNLYAQSYISVFDPVEVQIRQISKMKLDILDGYSGSLLLLAKEIKERGTKSIQPRLIFGSADLMDSSSIKFMEKTFGAPYLDQFGCAEIDRSAWQCPEKIGYHMDVDSVITQFVDASGNEVASGERGEIVYTSLFNYAMPLIRYSVGDIGIPSDEKCTCNRTFPLMKIVEGRKDSLILLPNGRLISPRLFRLSLGCFAEKFTQFRIVQKTVTHFEIYIQKSDPNIDENCLESKIISQLKNFLSLSEINIEVKFTDKIPLSKTGKLLSVVSEVKI